MKKFFLTLFSTIILFNSANTVDGSYYNEFDLYNSQPMQTCDASYGYMSFGVGPIIILPNAGIGYRSHKGHHGFDVSLSGTTVIEAHQIQGSLLYHFYPNPYRKDPWYMGAGVATSFWFTNHKDGAVGIAPDFVIGKEFATSGRKKHFIEAHVQAPTWGSDSVHMKNVTRIDFPIMYIKYGIGF